MFDAMQFKTLEKATQIAEELTTDRFSLTNRDWARTPFFVNTVGLHTSRRVTVPKDCFAHLVYYSKAQDKKKSPRETCGFYNIFVNDPKITDWLKKRPGFGLLPLLTYVMTHELVHIARFLRFHCHPLTDAKVHEEGIVHEVTSDILKRIKMDGLSAILEYFNTTTRRFSHADL